MGTKPTALSGRTEKTSIDSMVAEKKVDIAGKSTTKIGVAKQCTTQRPDRNTETRDIRGAVTFDCIREFRY